MFFPFFFQFQKPLKIKNLSVNNIAGDKLVYFQPFSFQLVFFSSKKPLQRKWNHFSLRVRRPVIKDVILTSLAGGEDPWGGHKTPFSAHIKEIWIRALFLFFSFFFSLLILLFFWKEIVYLFTTPMASFGRFFLSTHLSEPFYATLKICTALGLFLNYPFILYHFYSFFLPSLYKREKRGWDPIFYCSIIFSLLTIYFTSILILPLLLQFFFQFEILSGGGIGSFDSFCESKESEYSFSRNLAQSWDSGKMKENFTKKNPTLCQNSLFKSDGVSEGLKILLEPRIDLFVHWSLSLYLLSFFISQTPILLFFLFQRGFFRSSSLGKNRKGSLLFFYSSPLLYLPRIFLHSSSSFLFFIFFLRYRFGRFFSWRKGETLLKIGKGGFYSLNIEQVRRYREEMKRSLLLIFTPTPLPFFNGSAGL
uniref:SecY-independent transporter protein n=1 Tax=Botryococcus braunii TaxID=38881 RepID=A0A0U2EZY5_BOTBR|nr:SecY-independent transporter protein [Botryococcus braunii]AKU37087.1 SecY-independent transporter protein [Botryococcus braunii]